MPINSFLYPAKHVPGAFEVANSVRLQDAYFNRSVTPSSATSWTLSFWIKISGHNGSSEGYLWSCGSSSEAQGFYISASSYLGYYGATGYGSDSTLSQGVLRDNSAWYHICFSVNSGTGTLYINGVQDATMSSVAPLNAHTGNEMTVNTYSGDKAGFDNFLGYMAEYVFIDGTALTPTSFGEFDEDSPTIWKPIDVSGLTFGTNGFYLDFEDSSSLGNDAAGSNNFTVNNLTATDQSTDTCTNNALVLNPLSANASYVFSEGNLAVAINGVNNEKKAIPSTFGSSSGKWYWEVKNTSSSNQNYIYAGFVDADVIGQFITGSQSNAPYDANNGYGNFIQGSGTASAGIGIYKAGNSNYNTSTTYLTNQIGMFALDLDNRKAWFGVNGTWINDASGNTGNPATGANSTWDSDDLISTDKVWMPATAGYYSGPSCSYNFGSPPYAISSGNTDDNGYGNFEYDVPAGFYSWNTKNLAEFG